MSELTMVAIACLAGSGWLAFGVAIIALYTEG